MAELHEIDPGRARIEQIKKELRTAVEKAITDMGDEIAGFGLTVWSMGGRCFTAYDARYGLVYRGLVPSMVHDGLQRHITLDMVNEGAETTAPSDPA